jgi:hypothetical protein
MADDSDLADFALRLNEICDEMGVPPKGKARQLVIAKQFGVSQQGARKWLEGNGYCAIPMGKRIAAWAGVCFDWLMTGTLPKRPGDPTPPPKPAASPLLAASPRAARIFERLAQLEHAQASPPALYELIENALDLVQPRASGRDYPGLDDL